MIVICGLTPSALGTIAPSSTCTPLTPCTRPKPFDHRRPWIGPGAGGAERVERHERELASAHRLVAERARLAVAQRRDAPGRQDHLARPRCPVDLAQRLDAALDSAGVARAEVVADLRTAGQLAHRPARA